MERTTLLSRFAHALAFEGCCCGRASSWHCDSVSLWRRAARSGSLPTVTMSASCLLRRLAYGSHPALPTSPLAIRMPSLSTSPALSSRASFSSTSTQTIRRCLNSQPPPSSRSNSSLYCSLARPRTIQTWVPSLQILLLISTLLSLPLPSSICLSPSACLSVEKWDPASIWASHLLEDSEPCLCCDRLVMSNSSAPSPCRRCWPSHSYIVILRGRRWIQKWSIIWPYFSNLVLTHAYSLAW